MALYSLISSCPQGVASNWGGISANVLPPAARTLSLGEFLMEADACVATVLLAVDDSLTTTGQLQVGAMGPW